jgi:hypothetical protein
MARAGRRVQGSVQICSRFGALKRAFALVKCMTEPDEWDAITRRCTEGLLVYLALGRLSPAATEFDVTDWAPARHSRFFGS